jgi:hypothetical protein
VIVGLSTYTPLSSPIDSFTLFSRYFALKL